MQHIPVSTSRSSLDYLEQSRVLRPKFASILEMPIIRVVICIFTSMINVQFVPAEWKRGSFGEYVQHFFDRLVMWHIFILESKI